MNQMNRFTFVKNPSNDTDPFMYLEWNDEFLLIGVNPATLIELENYHNINGVEEVVTVMVQDLIANKTIEMFEAPLTQIVLEQVVSDIVEEKKLN